MFNWRDTVMTESQMATRILEPKLSYQEKCWKIANKQAEISFKAGIREVVKWIRDNHILDEWSDRTDKLWQAQLKEWEI